MMDSIISWVGSHLLNTDLLKNYLLNMVANYPWGSLALLIVAFSRSVFKPIMAVIEKSVKESPSQKDDEVLAKVEASKIYKAVAFVMDYLLSIKLDAVRGALPAPKEPEKK